MTKGMTKQLSQASLREKLFYNKAAEVEYIGTNELTVGDVVEVLTFKGKDKVLVVNMLLVELRSNSYHQEI